MLKGLKQVCFLVVTVTERYKLITAGCLRRIQDPRFDANKKAPLDLTAVRQTHKNSVQT